MTLVKISNIGDGSGALSVSRGGLVPTYGRTIHVSGCEYEVTDVRRFTSVKRPDAVLVDVVHRGECDVDGYETYGDHTDVTVESQ